MGNSSNNLLDDNSQLKTRPIISKDQQQQQNQLTYVSNNSVNKNQIIKQNTNDSILDLLIDSSRMSIGAWFDDTYGTLYKKYKLEKPKRHSRLEVSHEESRGEVSTSFNIPETSVSEVRTTENLTQRIEEDV